ncbi:tetratricopeptide repeat protein [Methyloversatilis thermotolerans]|uniref:tetratricopeptide repeat protein n=1 Tax=Methyloversatilis thermotolerans TaxID=1346290 RepID=UPI00035F5EC6|nr:tetratricopeptide repeat protein [Methyloversatilis thermotolerans]
MNTRPLLLAVLLPLVLGACAQTAKRPTAEAAGAPEKAVARAEEAPRTPPLPEVELTGQIAYQLLLAEVAAQRGDFGLSSAAYLDLAQSTRDPRIAKRAAEIASFSRQNEQALQATQLWLELDPESIQARQMLSGLLVNANRPQELEPQLAALLAQEGVQIGESLLRLNRVLARLSDKSEARRMVLRLTEPYLEYPEAWFARAQSALLARDSKSGFDEASKALELRPEWEAALLMKAQAQSETDPHAATRLMGDYLKRYPEAREVRLQYARMLVAERNFPEARRQFEAVMGNAPNNPDVVFAVGVLAMQMQDYAGAQTYFKKLLTLRHPDPNLIKLYLGQLAEELKQPDEALGWYKDVGQGEHYMGAQGRYVLLLSRMGRLDEARAHLRDMAARSPADAARAAMMEFQLLRDADRADEANKVLEDALAAQPDNPDLLYETAMVAERRHDVALAEQRLRRLIEVKPDHAHAYNALGYSLADRNERLDEAQALIARGLELAPDDPFILDSMGWVLFRRGDLNGALTYLQRAFDIRPDPEIAAHLGEVQWLLGRREEAEKLWRTVAAQHPDNAALEATIKRFLP